MIQLLSELTSKGEKYATEETVSIAFDKAKASSKKSKSAENLQWSDIKELNHSSNVEDLLKRMGLNRLDKNDGVLFLNGQYLEYNEESVRKKIYMSNNEIIHIH